MLAVVPREPVSCHSQQQVECVKYTALGVEEKVRPNPEPTIHLYLKLAALVFKLIYITTYLLVVVPHYCYFLAE